MNKQVHPPFAFDGMQDLPRQNTISVGFTALLPVLSAYIRAERNS